MKRWGIIAIIIIGIIFLGIIAGIIISNGDTSNSNPPGLKTLAEQNRIIKETPKFNETNVTLVTTSVSDIKTTPNTELQLKINYLDCGHTMIDKMDLPIELVNLDENEFLKKYGDDWKVEKFESSEIILSKREIGICNEHYVLREKDGYIAIYTIDKYGNETLKETTGIALQYLPQVDLQKIKDGIKISGKQELNATLEDYE